jgi:hypothetical protein
MFLSVILRPTSKNNDENWLDNAQDKNNKRFEYNNRNIIEASRARQEAERRKEEEAERIQRYKQYRQGKEPTYEEWKAAREKKD